MLRKVLAAGAVATAIASFALPAQAGQVCASAYAAVNGEALVDQSQCVDTP